MKKLSAVAIILIALVPLVGCSGSDSNEPQLGTLVDTPIKVSDTELVERHILVPDGTALTCLEYEKNGGLDKFTCFEIQVEEKELLIPLEDTEYVAHYYITRGKKTLVCLEDDGSDLIACVEKKR